MTLDAGFTLALGGGGARGYAHVGVAEALAERGLAPSRIIGTSMGSVIGAGLAAGLSPHRILAMAGQVDLWNDLRRPVRLGLFDHRPLMERLVREVGHPRIEDLPIPYAAVAMNLVTGRHELITSGPVADALARSCAISVVFAPIVDGDVIWADAGMWEPVPVSTARRWSPDPVLGVQVIGPKTALVRMGPVAWSLRTGARLLGTQPRGGRLSARRYTALLAERATDPVIHVEPDLLIRPNLWGVSWVNFAQVETPRRRGYEAAQRVLASVAVEEPRNLVRV